MSTNLANQPARTHPKPSFKTKPHHLNKKKLRQQIAKRDGDWCLLCGKPKGDLQIHRVIYGAQCGRYDLDNCVQLCPNCHVPVVHANKSKWQPYLLDYLKTKLEEEK